MGIIPEVKEADSLTVNEDTVTTVYAEVSNHAEETDESWKASDEWHDLVAARYGEHYTTEGGSADRSDAELALFTYAYGFAHVKGGLPKKEAVETVMQFMTHISEQTSYTKDGQPRKWLHRTDYQDRTASNAVRNFNESVWKAWVAQKGNRSDDYGWTRYHSLIQAARMLSVSGGGYDPDRYPNRKRLCKVARWIDTNPLAKGNYRKVLSYAVNRHGMLNKAYCGGNDYRYYPREAPDPPEAEWVESGGERRKPDSEAEP